MSGPGPAGTFEERAARITTAQHAVDRLDPEARAAAEELVAALSDHHAAVLRALVTRLRADDRGRELLYEAVDDAEVHAALVRAGIVRPSLAMRAVQVLDAVRPYLTSHNGDVELVRIEGGRGAARAPARDHGGVRGASGLGAHGLHPGGRRRAQACPEMIAAEPKVAASRATAARPRCWLGGPSAFGLMLPDASPTPSTMYAPRGVCLTADALIVADTGNHRILIWPGGELPADHSDAEVVLGQPDLFSEGPKLLFLPTSVAVVEGRLVVADAWHHRVLVWDEVPRRSGVAPSMVLGQRDLDGIGEGCGPNRFYWPFGVAMVGGVFWIADTGNRRVLGWVGGLPEPSQPPDVVLGQPDLWSRGENRDGPVAADSLRWPHALAGLGDRLFVADAGNHRVLGWDAPLAGGPADLVMGQPGFTTSVEVPNRPQGPRSFRFPYAVATSPTGSLFVADTSNNRIGVVTDARATFAAQPVGGAVDLVLGQPDLDASGENRWSKVEADTFCWPYGLSYEGGRLAVADSGNNRVMVWAAP